MASLSHLTNPQMIAKDSYISLGISPQEQEVLAQLQFPTIPQLQFPTFLDNGVVDGHVTRICLENVPLRSLPAVIAKLTELKYIRFKNNHMRKVPKALGSLAKLTSLIFQFNPIKDIPESIGNLHYLQSLSLNNTKISHLPSSIGQLKSLKNIRINHCALETIPASFRHLQQLEVIDLSSNQLHTFPQFICALPNLTVLNIAHNQISEIPECLGDLSYLKRIRLEGNPLLSLPSLLNELDGLFKAHFSTDFLTSHAQDLAKQKRWREVVDYYRRSTSSIVKQVLADQKPLTKDEHERFLHEANFKHRQIIENTLPADHWAVRELLVKWAVPVHHKYKVDGSDTKEEHSIFI